MSVDAESEAWVVTLEKRIADLYRRAVDLERQLESARSLAVDRDQRLGWIADLLAPYVRTWPNAIGVVDAYHVARGEEDA